MRVHAGDGRFARQSGQRHPRSRSRKSISRCRVVRGVRSRLPWRAGGRLDWQPVGYSGDHAGLPACRRVSAQLEAVPRRAFEVNTPSGHRGHSRCRRCTRQLRSETETRAVARSTSHRCPTSPAPPAIGGGDACRGAQGVLTLRVVPRRHREREFEAGRVHPAGRHGRLCVAADQSSRTECVAGCPACVRTVMRAVAAPLVGQGRQPGRGLRA